jgi:hypothetical protein
MLKYSLVIALSLWLSAPAVAQESYLCITDSSAGLSFDKQLHTWTPASFPGGRKFIFRQKRDEDNATMPWVWTWALFPFSSTEQWAVCGKDFEISDLTQECGGIYEFAFNRKTLRFQIYYKFGFAYPSTGSAGNGTPSSESEGNDTPFIAIGTCSLL